MDIITLVHRFSGLVLAPKTDDDFSDRLSYRYTSGLLILFSIVILSKQYGSVGNIKCWIPAHFTRNYEDYITQICWVTNTYKIAPNEPIWKNDVRKKENEITYYQWVVFLLLLQAFFFYLPRIFWNTASTRAGISLCDIIQSANNYKSVERFEDRAGQMKYLVDNIDQYVDDERRFNHRRPKFIQRILLALIPFSGRYLGNYLVILYFVVKLMYIGNTFLQGFLITGVLGSNYFKFGIEFILSLIRKQSQSIESIYFPKTALCDFYIREVGNPKISQRHTVQCVLPINLFNQQIFTVIWFWLLFVQLCNFFELFKWIYRCIPYNSSSWVKTHVRLYDRKIERNSNKLKHFIDPYLEADGMFMIHMIANNVGNHVASDLVFELWKKHNAKYSQNFEICEET